MIDGFIAKVKSGSGLSWVVEPQIINNDGKQHPDITVGIRDGIKPLVNDLVIILTIKNNLDFLNINMFYQPSYTNGIIIGIAKTQENKYYLDGNYNFTGDTVNDGKLNVTKDVTFDQTLQVKGNTRSFVTHGELQTWINTMMSGLKGAIDIGLNAAGIPPNPAAAGLFDTAFALISTDISAAKTDNVKTGAG